MRNSAKVFLVASLATSIASAALATDHTVLMTGDYGGAMFFDPSVISIQAGDRVRWTNNVAVTHTATSGTDCVPDGLWTTGSIGPGGTSGYVTFNTLGSFNYYCRFHCEVGMTGVITVTQPPVRTESTTWGRIKSLYATRG
jgi:plastocyanin